MFKTNKNDGITLVALVITIVVMLILAAVTISLVLGENGVLTQAQKSRYVQEGTDLRDKIIETLNSNVVDRYAAYAQDTTPGGMTLGDLTTEIRGIATTLGNPNSSEIRVTSRVGATGTEGTVTTTNLDNGSDYYIKVTNDQEIATDRGYTFDIRYQYVQGGTAKVLAEGAVTARRKVGASFQNW